MNKKTAFILIIILLIVAGGALWWQNKNAVKAYEFTGKVKSVSGSGIQVQGGYKVTDHPELSDLKNFRDVTVVIGSQTKLVKTVTYLPGSGKPGEKFEYSKLRSEIMPGSIEDLKSIPGIAIDIKSSRNIYGKATFLASEITYHMDQTEIK